jgi:hypothetical protein
MDTDSIHENLERNTKAKHSDILSNDRNVFQSIWVRYSSIFPNSDIGKFMESQLSYVYHCGFLFWIIYLITL